MNICQSCGMPLEEKTTSKHDPCYCIYCQNQDTSQLATYDQVRQGSIDAAVRLMGKTVEEATKIANEMLPLLPRWQK
ncbi:hypothetical protein A3K55_01645 [Candidatus Shapirobacteria bacterium RBG_13_44_7]|uniref:Putative zinc ribbon domain-containing protein n=1 Tax=Candidatus Shapirobacteria bacterium RBG_13_44_7 TaxID=1802149 RepID=A0A1F7SKX9_9BACT|nr:MAG: hypothetical protein A3K55_01645 [Candidatus Shapirobacteria bacterium RBG_13_44_7]